MGQAKIVVVGSLNMDIVVEAERAPQLGETVRGQTVHFIPGGKGANQAVAAARLGAQTTLIGSVGEDAFGADLLKALAKEGISQETIKLQPGTATGVASILLVQKDNQIVVVPGANAACLPKDVQQQENIISQADVVLLQLEIPLETVVETAALAKRYGKTVILNPAPARELPTELLHNVDYITPNRSELTLLSGTDPKGPQLQIAMEALAAKGPKHVITTLGSAGVAYLQSGAGLVTVPSYQVPVVDTTGAGDAFNGGLAYGLALGQALAKAVMFGCKVAALAVTKLGAQGGMPSLADVEKSDWF